jgi:hypothetical protein
MPSIKEILAAKLSSPPPEEIREESPCLLPSSTPEDKESLLPFLLLYYRAHAKDVFVEQGKGAKLLYLFFDSPSISPSNIPDCFTIRDQYILHNILGLSVSGVFSLLKEFYEQKFPLTKTPEREKILPTDQPLS